MDQYSYETIMACIKSGAPAIAPQLITAFNNVVNLANERSQEIQAQRQIEQQKAAAKAQTAAKKK